MSSTGVQHCGLLHPITFIPVRLRTELGPCMISGFDLQVDEICILLSHYVTCSVNFLPKFQDTLSVPSSRVKNPSII